MKLSFKEPNPGVDELIQQLLETAGVSRRLDIVRQMLIAALKAGQEAESDADLKLMNTTLKEMRFTAKAFSPYRQQRKVTVFGSARTTPDDPLYKLARDLGEVLAEAGFMVITGAGAGIMQAANEGAGPANSFGVNIQLPFEQKPNSVLAKNPRLVNYKYFFNRKVAFIKQADAVVLFPGGFGTLDEAMEILTLLQTGKRYLIPLILFDRPGGSYWQDAVRFFREELLGKGYIAPSDLDLLVLEDDVHRASRRVADFYRNYHSMRYFDGKLAVRLQRAPPPMLVDQLERQFADLLMPGGKIWLANEAQRTLDDPEYRDLELLMLDHNLCEFARLGALIHELNRFANGFGEPRDGPQEGLSAGCSRG